MEIIENLTNPNQAPVDGDRIRRISESGSYVEYNYSSPLEVVDTNTYLHIDYPEFVSLGNSVDLTVSVRFADDTLAPVSSTYYVPVLRLADGKQIAFLTINFSNGTANVSFTPSEAGVYTMDMGKIRPLPTAIITSNPEIIVA